MKRYTRFLCMALCLALCLSLLPATALAEEDNSGDFSTAGEESNEIVNENAETVVNSSEEGESTADIIGDETAELTVAGLVDQSVYDEDFILDDTAEDNVDLFEGYVNQAFHGSACDNDDIMLMSLNHQAGDYLSGNEKIMYDSLKEQIEKVASGEDDCNYTQLGVPIDSLETQITYTAAELGVDEITSKNVTTLYKQALGFDPRNVVNALLADCPYELYWFAKTKGFSMSANYAWNDSCITFIKTGSVWFKFYVSADFAQDPTADKTFYTDLTKTTATTQAVANAQSIVAEVADYTDYDKLVYYRDKICDLVSYNKDAAEGAAAGTVSYGDPWQILYVFDNDTSTNVVCEGYAKAFKYLCDMTQFSNSEISCIQVTGTVQQEGYNAGSHMWNLVHMPDGGNYLVDVTNCDSGTIGAPDYLFLRGTDSGSVSDGYVITVGETSTTINVTYKYSTTEVAFQDPDLELSTASYYDSLDDAHGWGDWSKDDTTGIHTRTCTVCGLTETCIPGDVNRDYEVNLKDVLVLKEWLSGQNVEIYESGADFNWDSEVNLKDLLLLKRQLANT